MEETDRIPFRALPAVAGGEGGQNPLRKILHPTGHDEMTEWSANKTDKDANIVFVARRKRSKV